MLPVAALLLLASSVPARPEPPSGAPFAEAIDVRVANVDVTVTGRDGRPVRGLSRDDFELVVDGKRTEIVNFSEISEGSLAGPGPAAPSVSDGSGTAVPPSAALPEAPPLSLVVFVDNDQLQPFGRNRILRQLHDFLLSAVGPRDRVMLVTHEQGLNVRRPLTAGTASLPADLAKLEKLGARGAIRESWARRTQEEIRDLGCERADEAEQIARAYAQEVGNGAKLSLNALSTVVASLSGVEGRKAVLYVGAGLEMHPGEQMFELLHETCGTASAVMQTEDLATRFRALSRLANAEGVTFYTLATTGLRNFSSASAEENPLPISPLAAADLDFEKEGDAQQVLFHLASETGGRAVLNGSDIRPDLARIAADLRSYYSLGYTPPPTGDGAVHPIRVRVRREGVTVHSRTGYASRSREEELASRVEAVLLHGITDNPLQATLELASAEPGKRGEHLVTLRLRLPLRQLVLLAQGDAWTGQLTLWIAARDAAGRVAPVQSVRVPVRIPAKAGRAQLEGSFAYDLRMRMAERGEQTVAVGAQDDLAHTVSFLSAVFRVDRKGVTAVPPGRR